MGWMIVILCCDRIFLARTQRTDSIIRLRNSDCGTRYDADIFQSIYLEYHGSDILTSNPCSVEFNKSSLEKCLCISAQEISLDCSTKLEYHEYFVKNYIEPEKRILCNDTTVGEWCSSRYLDNIFVVIRKGQQETFDSIKLRIYLKDVPDSNSSNVTTAVVVGTLVSIVVLGVIILLLCLKLKTSRMAAANRQQIVYRTTTGTYNAQTGYPAYQHEPGQQAMAPLVQGDYHVHPMQTAYPETQTSDQQGVNSQQYPSAPPMPQDATPPPSYESVVRS